MAKLIALKSFSDQRGTLSVLEAPEIPFNIKRVFFIHDANGAERGGHRHHNTVQALICISGSCEILNHNGHKESQFVLENPSQCLILYPEDWHLIHHISEGAIILVLASTTFDESDYIFEPYSS